MSYVHVIPAEKNTFAVFGTRIEDPGVSDFAFHVEHMQPVLGWRIWSEIMSAEHIVSCNDPIGVDGSLTGSDHIGYKIGDKFYDLEGYSPKGVV